MNIDLIPCEICSQQFPLDQYIIHITTHGSNDNFSSNTNTNKTNTFQSYPPSNTNTNTNNNNNFSSDTIPCDQCQQQIPLNQYESHIITHSISSNNNNSSNIAPSIINTDSIPCTHCNKQIAFNEYEQHQLLHLDDPNNTNSSNPNNNNNIMIECQYTDCSTKWIPKNEYDDHLTLHRLQSQQAPNTSNDELIAFNHQTQLIQQQTLNMNASNNTSIPDPRRICTSTAFIHLNDTQQPVIPLHDALKSSISTPIHGAQSIPSRDRHNVHGIIEAIDDILYNRHHIEYYLCDPLSFYYRDKEDYSWGCGFRNCQTLSSCLILKKDAYSIYNKILFNGIGYVPIIEQLQRYLDYAHAQGFDPEGLKELGQTEGSRVWIGAVDVAAMLRSFYIPASIFDFQLNSNQTEHNHLFQWIWHYFEQRYIFHGIKRGNHSINNNEGNQPLISSYFEAATTNTNNNNNNNNNNNSNNGHNAFDIMDYGGFSDDDVMMKKALEMSKKEMMMNNSMNNNKKKKKSKNDKKYMQNKNNNNNKNNNGKMEMDDDSDSGSSFSDDDDENVMMMNNKNKNKNKEEEDEEEEEEKKSDENDEDLFCWNKEEEIKKDSFNKSVYDKKKKMMNDNNNNNNNNNKINNNSYNKRFIPPLYFQHQGHSRTIIGIIYNKKSGIRHLLVLDPSVKKGAVNLLNNIKNGNISQLLRSKKQIKAPKYQIVAIPAYGIMTNNDRNRCKTIQSMDVTLINKNKNKSSH